MQREPQRIIGESSGLFDILEQASMLAPLNRPVLVVGERGSGKELIAERLHYLSPRWERPLQKLNCAAISESLLDSDLFGHEKGAFTGADQTRYGRFERADGGTLFLDELGAMPLPLQEKLLRVIEYGEFERLGGQKTLTVKVRIVAATHADLPAMARQHKFRWDLLDRLAFDVINVPALRHRQEDILELAEYFAVKMCHELGWDYFAGFASEAKAELLAYPWPGNIRELKNAVERSVYRWGAADTAVEALVIDPFKPSAGGAGGDHSGGEQRDIISPHSANSEIAQQPCEQRGVTSEGLSPNTINFAEQSKQYEIQLVRTALARCNHHQKNTAKALGLSYHQLRALLRKYKSELS